MLVLLGRSDFPVEGIAAEPLLTRPLPVGEDLAGLLERGQRVELEGDGRLGGGEVGAGVAVDGFPGGEEDVGDVAEWSALSGAGVGADPGGDFECFAAELEADAVLGVAAVDFVADPDAGVDVAAAALQEEREAAEVSLEHVAGRPRVVRGGDLRPASDRDGMCGVAEGDGDRVAVEVVDADHADGWVDRMVGHLSEHVAPVAGLATVDADRALAPAAADPRRLQPAVRLHRSLDEPAPQVALVPRPERHVLVRIGHRHELGQRGSAVVVAQVQEHVGDRRVERVGDGGPQPQALRHADHAEVDRDQRHLRVPVAEHEDRRRQVALDRLDRGAEQPQACLAGAEQRVDRPPGGPGVERRSHSRPPMRPVAGSTRACPRARAAPSRGAVR